MRKLMQSAKGFVINASIMAMALGGFLIFGGAPAAQAQEFNRPAVRYDNFRAREAAIHHGYYSRQAEYWRFERREAFRHGWCDRFGHWHRY